MKTLLQLLGLRTACCNAKIISWHHDKHYCEACEQWLGQPKLQPSPVETQPSTVIRKRIAH